ncbi:MAG: adenylyltransferase/cytidyltransferase family protein [Candidatus Methanomethylophilaceae archaeon]|nr:adenylyltransferase/cytidyltransferase family protein [Candidatus Methanomethylophilaceae archaeon]
MSKQYSVGLTTGVFDVLHPGHLNLFENCKKVCDKLVVGICTDEYSIRYKNKKPLFNEEERLRIVSSLKSVDSAFIVSIDEVEDKTLILDRCRFDVLFSGSDWQGSERFAHTQAQFDEIGIDIVFFPYTAGISTTDLLDRKRL